MANQSSLDDLTQQIMMVPLNKFRERVPDIIEEYLRDAFHFSQLQIKDVAQQKLIDELFERLRRRRWSP